MSVDILPLASPHLTSPSSPQAAGAAAKVGLTTVDAGIKVVQQGIEIATPFAKEVYDVVEPVVEEAVKSAAPVVSSAAPAVQQQLNEAVTASGVPVSAISNSASTVLTTVNQGVSVATPYVNSAVEFLSSKDPQSLSYYGLGAAALYYTSPLLLGALAGALRGYAGSLPAAEVLNEINTDRNTVLIDVRSEVSGRSKLLLESINWL